MDPSEPGFRGILDIIEWRTPDCAIARLIDPNDDNQPIIYVWITSPHDQTWHSRAFMTVEKDFEHRLCILKVMIEPDRDVKVTWHLDVNPYSNSPR